MGLSTSAEQKCKGQSQTKCSAAEMEFMGRGLSPLWEAFPLHSYEISIDEEDKVEKRRSIDIAFRPELSIKGERKSKGKNVDEEDKVEKRRSIDIASRPELSIKGEGKSKGGKNVDEEDKVEKGRKWSIQRSGQALLVAARKRLMNTLHPEKKAFTPDDHRSLYLCFGEYEEGSKVSYTILSVSLCQLFPASSPQQLRLVIRFSGDGLPRYMGCGVWGSKILFGGGAKPAYMHFPSRGQPVSGCFIHHQVRKIYCFETTEETQVLVPLPKMLKGNIQPLLVEVDNKLYALGKSLPSFEMFDGNDWSKLASPPHGTFLCYPFTHSDPTCQFDIYYAVAGTNMLVSDGGSSFCFDTAKPSKGWRRLMSADQFSFDQFCFKGTCLVVNDGKQFVLFTFQPSDGQHISVHLISYDFDNITQDYSRVQLPSYLMECKDDCLGDLPLPNYRLVHLRDNIVCLLMSELRPSGVDDAKKKMIRCVEFVTFTFKVRDNARQSLKIRFLPRIPKLIYDDDNDDDINMAYRAGQMLGAFLL